MSTPNLKQSAIALALLQAFTINTHAQEAIPEVVIKGQLVAADRAAAAWVAEEFLERVG